MKANLLEMTAFDCDVRSSSTVGACRPPAFYDGSPSKLCSPLEVVGPSGAEHLAAYMSRTSPQWPASFHSRRRGAHDCPIPAEWAEASRRIWCRLHCDAPSRF